MTRRRTLGMMSVGLTAFVAASSAGMPPAVLTEPPPAGTTVTTVVLPVAPPRGSGTAPLVPVFPSPPPLPVAPPAHIPERPAGRRAPVVRPVEVDITEPVTTVHRFEGRYLGGDKSRTLLYRATGPDTAEIQSRSLANAIPAADTEAKDDVRRIEVPAGAAVWHGGRVFLTTKRELLVIDSECRTDWKFALPGKPDNGESLLGIAGFYEDKLVLAAQHEGPPNGTEKATGRLLTFDAATGRQVGFATVKGGFDANAQLSLDARHGTVVAVTHERMRIHELATGAVRWSAPIPARAGNPTVSNGVVFATARDDVRLTAVGPPGVGMPGRGDGGFEVLARDATATAPPRFVADASAYDRAYLPVASAEGQFALAAYEVRVNRSSVEWWARVPKALTAAPVVHGQSVYFAAGNALYRADRANGAVCWKQTVSLNPGEALTELTFADGELRASGPGVLVRVAERTEPRLRDLFRFGSER